MSPRQRTIATTLAQAARALPNVSCGVACEGTALEARTFATAIKTFLFIGAKDARLKLADSAVEACGFPGTVNVGTGGWTRISLAGDGPPTPKTLTRWVAESHRLAAGPAGRPPSARPKKR